MFPPGSFRWYDSAVRVTLMGASGRRNVSLRGLLVAGLMDCRDPGALLLNRRGEFLRRAQARRGADTGHTRPEGGIGDDRAGIGRDTRLDLRRHVAPAVDAGDAVEGEVGIAHLRASRHVRRLRRALAIGHEEELGGAGP